MLQYFLDIDFFVHYLSINLLTEKSFAEIVVLLHVDINELLQELSFKKI